jgi:hypothetical protein
VWIDLKNAAAEAFPAVRQVDREERLTRDNDAHAAGIQHQPHPQAPNIGLSSRNVSGNVAFWGQHVRYTPIVMRGILTNAAHGATIAGACTSLGEASVGTKATDLERRETPRVRTALPGLRVEPKWLPGNVPDTPCSAKAQREGCLARLIRRVTSSPCAT